MKTTVTVGIAGNEYRLVSEEGEEYMRRVASRVDSKISEVLQTGTASLVEAAVLAAINISDEYYKALDTAENLRVQLKDYLEESGRMKAELAELRRELVRMGK